MPEGQMMEDIFSERIDLGDGSHADAVADEESVLSPEDAAHLVAAMARLASQGDHAGVAKLAQLAKEPEKLHQIIGEMPAEEPDDNRYPPGYYMTEDQQKAIWDKIFRIGQHDDSLADLLQAIHFGIEEEMPPEEREKYLAELKLLFPNGYKPS